MYNTQYKKGILRLQYFIILLLPTEKISKMLAKSTGAVVVSLLLL